MTDGAGRESSRLTAADLLVALAVAAAALALFVTTLQPDFGGPEDTPKFQFLGYVLGTAHPPGYPLYVLLSHLFVQMPLGTIAYRANLFSAVMAAFACGLACLIARQHGVGRVASAASAMALASGASFWRSAVFAEVYSLAAAITAGTIVLLLEWGARHSVRWLLAAVGTFSMGLGNHLTVIGLAPACAIYVIVRDRRALTPRVVAAGVLLVLLGLAQYGFIVLRTRQGGTYLESRASNLAELAGVITAERFAEQRFAFSPRVLLTDHLPSLASVVAVELGVAGVLLAIGMITAMATRNQSAGLAAGAALGMLAVIVNMSGDLKGFITPVMVLLWPLVALGTSGLRRALSAARAPTVLAKTLAATAAVAVAVINMSGNYAEADNSGQGGSARFLRSMFRQLPERAAVVTEDYWSDMAFAYYRATGEAGPWRDFVRVGLDPADVRAAVSGPSPRRVFALAAGAAILAADGFSFTRAPVEGPPLPDWLNVLPRRAIVVGATAAVPIPFDPATIGRPGARPPGRPRTYEVFSLVAHGSHAMWRGDDTTASLTGDQIAADLRMIAASGPVAVLADARGARIEVGGDAVAYVARGLAIAAFDGDGRLLRTVELPDGAPLRVDFQEALYELQGESPCADVTGERWSDLGGVLSTGSVVATVDRLEAVAMELEVEDMGDVRVFSWQLLGDGRAILRRAQSSDGLIRLTWELQRNPGRRPLFRLAFDRVPRSARARLRPDAARRLRLCSFRPSRNLGLDQHRERVLRADFESEAYFGPGWTTALRTATGTVRRAVGPATILLPLANPIACRISFEGTAPAPVSVTVNERPIARCNLGRTAACDIDVPAVVTQAGLNSITLSLEDPADTAHSARMTLRAARFSCGG